MFDSNKITAKELVEKSKIPLLVKEQPYEIFIEYAVQMISEITENNKIGKKTVFIIPCGPVEQYPVFARLVNQLKIDLKNTWIIHMDEYITESEELISENDQFSFRKCMNECLYSLIDSNLVMPPKQRIFPNPKNLNDIPALIERLGGVDIAFGGVALNGHIAFNEPQPDMDADEYSLLSTRIVTLSTETRVKEAILSRGGAVDTVPKKAITIGMKEILAAKKIRLSMMLDMQRSVIRKACIGEISAACPVSLIQNHQNALLMVTKNVTEKPF